MRNDASFEWLGSQSSILNGSPLTVERFLLTIFKITHQNFTLKWIIFVNIHGVREYFPGHLLIVFITRISTNSLIAAAVSQTPADAINL